MAINDPLQQLKDAGLQIDNPDFLNEYSGRQISYGDQIYQVDQNGVSYLGNANPQVSAEYGKPDFRYTSSSGVLGFDPVGGLTPLNAGSSGVTLTKDDYFKYLTPEQKANVIEQQGLNPEDTRFTADVTPEQQQQALQSTGGEGAARLEEQRKANEANLVVPPDTGGGISIAATDNVTNAVAKGDIPFKEGLTPEQRASITNLLNNRPDSGTWTPTDISNWNYATNNAPLPGGGGQSFNAGQLTSEQKFGLDAAAQRAAQGTANETDLKNLAYAEQNYGYQPPEVKSEEQAAVEKLLADKNIQVDPEQEPKTQFKNVYQQSLLDSGAVSAKTQAEGYAKELRDLNDKKDEEIRDINDNPWLTEGIRQRRIASIENKYESKIGNLTGQFNLTQGLYETAVNEAQFLASQSMTQNRWQQEMDQALQFKLMDQATKELEALNNRDTSIITANGRKILVDNQTGDVITDFGSSSSGGSGGGSGGGGGSDTEPVKLTPEDIRTLKAYDSQGFNFSNASIDFQLAFTNLLTKTQRNDWINQYKADQNLAGYSIDPELHLEQWLNKQDSSGTDTSFLDE